MVLVGADQAPVEVVRPVVDVIGVVVTPCRAKELVAAAEQWGSEREQGEGEAVAGGLALERLVATLVPGPAAPVSGEVKCVEIVEGRAVVLDDGIDRVPGLAAVVLEQIARAGEAIREDAGRDVREAETVLLLAEVVAVPGVPLGPAGREVALLLAVLAAVAGVRLGDQVDPRPAVGRAYGQFTDGGSGGSHRAACP